MLPAQGALSEVKVDGPCAAKGNARFSDLETADSPAILVSVDNVSTTAPSNPLLVLLKKSAWFIPISMLWGEALQPPYFFESFFQASVTQALPLSPRESMLKVKLSSRQQI